VKIPEPVIRHRRTVTGTDVYNRPTYSEATLTIAGALVDPGPSSEPGQAGRKPVLVAPTLYFRDAHPDIVDTDQVTLRGARYDVDGFPQAWPSGVVVKLRLARG